MYLFINFHSCCVDVFSSVLFGWLSAVYCVFPACILFISLCQWTVWIKSRLQFFFSVLFACFTTGIYSSKFKFGCTGNDCINVPKSLLQQWFMECIYRLADDIFSATRTAFMICLLYSLSVNAPASPGVCVRKRRKGGVNTKVIHSKISI